MITRQAVEVGVKFCFGVALGLFWCAWAMTYYQGTHGDHGVTLKAGESIGLTVELPHPAVPPDMGGATWTASVVDIDTRGFADDAPIMTIQVGHGDRMVTIAQDGSVKLSPGVDNAAGARAFWEAVAEANPTQATVRRLRAELDRCACYSPPLHHPAIRR